MGLENFRQRLEAQRRAGSVGLVVAVAFERRRADEHEPVAGEREARIVEEIGHALGRGERGLGAAGLRPYDDRKRVLMTAAAVARPVLRRSLAEHRIDRLRGARRLVVEAQRAAHQRPVVGPKPTTMSISMPAAASPGSGAALSTT